MFRNDPITVPGSILVREVNNCFSFGLEDEYSELIFIALGSQKINHYGFDIDYNAARNGVIDIFSGEPLNRGTRTIPIENFFDWVNNMRFLLDENPKLVEKIKTDFEENVTYGRFNKVKSLQVANAIIRHAKFILRGLETGRFKLPRNVKTTFTIIKYEDKLNDRNIYIRNLKDLLEQCYDENLSEDDIERINTKIEETKKLISCFDPNPTDEEVQEMIEKILIGNLKRIASIVPFDCVISHIDEERIRHKKYNGLKINEKEPNKGVNDEKLTNNEPSNNPRENKSMYEPDDELVRQSLKIFI